MIRTATALALFVTQMIAFAAFAQADTSARSTNEFGRTFGGEIEMILKQSRNLSGSVGLMRSTGTRGEGYEAALGGSLVEDRIWFFASASRLPVMELGSRFSAVDGSVTAQPVDWTSISASFSDRRNAIFTAPGTTAVPSSFLSLRSTSVLSDKMIVSISASRR
jgi:hypothetical protein